MQDINIMPPSHRTVPTANPERIVRQLLISDETFATTLLVIAIDTFGSECMAWHPETLKMELEQTYSLRLPKKTLDKLMAAVAIVTTDGFYRDVSKFIQLANILAGDDFQPDEFAPADAVECAWAITEAMLLDPPDLQQNPEPFSDEIRRYLSAVLRDEGYTDPPDVLRIAVHDKPGSAMADFADDPAMAKGVFEIQQGKNDEVTNTLKEHLAMLVQQIDLLPLTNGTKSGFMEKMKQAVAKVDPPEQPLKG